jgi:hypothetical protein
MTERSMKFCNSRTLPAHENETLPKLSSRGASTASGATAGSVGNSGMICGASDDRQSDTDSDLANPPTPEQKTLVIVQNVMQIPLFLLVVALDIGCRYHSEHP